jgi:hypothetical protein
MSTYVSAWKREIGVSGVELGACLFPLKTLLSAFVAMSDRVVNTSIQPHNFGGVFANLLFDTFRVHERLMLSG